jgi:hypothetical protein
VNWKRVVRPALVLAGLIFLNASNQCDPGYCGKYGFPLEYFRWSDEIPDFNGVTYGPRFSPLGFAVDAVITVAAVFAAFRRSSPTTPRSETDALAASPHLMSRSRIALFIGVAIFLWQYVVISNFGILPQVTDTPGGTGFSYVVPPRPIKRLLGRTARIAWFPVCALIAGSYDHPAGSGHWSIRVRHLAFHLGLIPPEDSRANGIPLAATNTLAWLIMLSLVVIPVYAVASHGRARA